MSDPTMTRASRDIRSRPLISFVIPVRDDAERLRRCLESIEANGYSRREVEVIVIDNGSGDGSTRVACEAGAIVRRVTRATVAELRNHGARVARGELLAFVDADHEIDSTWVASAIDALADHHTGAVGAAYQAPADGTWVQRVYDGLRRRTPGRRDVLWLASGNLAMRAEVFRQVGGFDGALETCEDVDLCARVRAAGYRVVSDDRLRSIHLGDPPTLRALFLSELWRGRDNLRMSIRGAGSWRDLPSVAIPVVHLVAVAAVVAGVVTAPLGGALLAAVAIAAIPLVSSLRAVRILASRRRFGAVAVAQSFAIALVYDLARAAAIVLRTGHGTRRAACAR
jgi:GT2 family glycosyltransferase